MQFSLREKRRFGYNALVVAIADIRVVLEAIYQCHRVIFHGTKPSAMAHVDCRGQTLRDVVFGILNKLG